MRTHCAVRLSPVYLSFQLSVTTERSGLGHPCRGAEGGAGVPGRFAVVPLVGVGVAAWPVDRHGEPDQLLADGAMLPSNVMVVCNMSGSFLLLWWPLVAGRALLPARRIARGQRCRRGSVSSPVCRTGPENRGRNKRAGAGAEPTLLARVRPKRTVEPDLVPRPAAPGKATARQLRSVARSPRSGSSEGDGTRGEPEPVRLGTRPPHNSFEASRPHRAVGPCAPRAE